MSLALKQVAHFGVQRFEHLRLAGVHLGQLDVGYAAIPIFFDDDEVNDIDEVIIDQFLQGGQDFALELIARKGQFDVLDGADSHAFAP